MTRQVEPKAPKAVGANLHKVPSVDFSFFDKLGDSQINAANNNFKLYAQNLLAIEQQKLFDQYSSDPVNLANALGKLPEMINDLPPEIQEQMQTKLAVSNIGLIQKAQNNQLNALDTETANNATTRINTIRAGMAETYGNVLQNAISPADQKNMIANDDFIQQLSELQEMAALKNHKGKDLYTAQQKKQILNISDAQLEAAKQFVDKMILNDDEKLTNTQDYYTKFILAPERFMKDNFMDRKTYDKVRAYVKKQLEQAKVDVKGKRFNQSIMEATALQKQDLPGVKQFLLDEGVIDKGLINRIEKTNVKFNDIDPSKTESADTFLTALQVITEQKYNPTPTTQEEQQKILEQGVVALDAVADLAQRYGMSPENVRRTRETVATLETDAAFAPILDNFREIIDNFDTGLSMARKRSKQSGTFTGMINDVLNRVSVDSYEDAVKIKRLNDLLAVGTDRINQLIRNGDWDGVREEQKRIQVEAALIKYPWVNYDAYKNNQDEEFVSPNGRVVKVKKFLFNGDIMFETVDK